MVQRLKIEADGGEAESISKELTRRNMSLDKLLFRALAVDPSLAHSKIRDIVKKGTDRISDKTLGNGFANFYNLEDEEDPRLIERGRPLKPSEYTWLTDFEGLQTQVDQIVANYVLAYRKESVIQINPYMSCYEFVENPRVALKAIIELS